MIRPALLFLFLPVLIYSQSELELKVQIDSIVTSEDAKAFIKENKSLKAKLLTFNKEKHKTTLADALFELGNGGRKSFKNERSTTTYKVINREKVPHYRVSVIAFDPKERNAAEINQLSSVLINAYKSGNRRFEDLAKVYSSGRSSKTGGDLGWLKTGQQSDAFEKAVSSHQSGDIFFFNDPSNSKKYVILKTEDWTPIEEITVLRFKEPKV